MGSGLYDLLGWGMIDPPVQVDAEGYIIELDDLEGLGLRDTNETEPPCLVVPIAVSLPFLQDYWSLLPLPDWTPRVMPRQTRRCAAPQGFQVTEEHFQRWRDAQAVYRRAGMVLPEAYLVVLSDWD